jgi:hypothetical protein
MLHWPLHALYPLNHHPSHSQLLASYLTPEAEVESFACAEPASVGTPKRAVPISCVPPSTVNIATLWAMYVPQTG